MMQESFPTSFEWSKAAQQGKMLWKHKYTFFAENKTNTSVTGGFLLQQVPETAEFQ